MIRVGVAVFVVGVICTLIAMSPLITGTGLPGVMWFLAMLMGVGFVLISLGLVRNARARGAAVRRSSRAAAS